MVYNDQSLPKLVKEFAFAKFLVEELKEEVLISVKVPGGEILTASVNRIIDLRVVAKSDIWHVDGYHFRPQREGVPTWDSWVFLKFLWTREQLERFELFTCGGKVGRFVKAYSGEGIVISEEYPTARILLLDKPHEIISKDVDTLLSLSQNFSQNKRVIKKMLDHLTGDGYGEVDSKTFEKIKRANTTLDDEDFREIKNLDFKTETMRNLAKKILMDELVRVHLEIYTEGTHLMFSKEMVISDLDAEEIVIYEIIPGVEFKSPVTFKKGGKEFNLVGIERI